MLLSGVIWDNPLDFHNETWSVLVITLKYFSGWNTKWFCVQSSSK